MAEFTEAISAMVTEEARGYIDTRAETDGVGVGKVIRRLLDKGIEAERLTGALHDLGELDPEDDVLRSAARQVRTAMRRRVRTGAASLEGIATLGAGLSQDARVPLADRIDIGLPDPVGPTGAKDRQADRLEHVAGETPRPPGAPASLEWHPDPKVRAARARAALEQRPGGTA